MSDPHGSSEKPRMPITLPFPDNPLRAARDEADTLVLGAGFKETDMMFNIARLEGRTPRGYDLIDPETKERVYITQPGSAESERIVAESLGSASVLQLLERTEDYAKYKVPSGARLLQKTLKSAPYHERYMRGLAKRTLLFLDHLAELDSDAFGIDLSNIAITHNGDDDVNDDTLLTVVPPLQPHFQLHDMQESEVETSTAEEDDDVVEFPIFRGGSSLPQAITNAKQGIPEGEFHSPTTLEAETALADSIRNHPTTRGSYYNSTDALQDMTGLREESVNRLARRFDLTLIMPYVRMGRK